MIYFCKTVDIHKEGKRLISDTKKCNECDARIETHIAIGLDRAIYYGVHNKGCRFRKESYFYKLGADRGREIASRVKLPTSEAEIEEVKIDLVLDGIYEPGESLAEILYRHATTSEKHDRQCSLFEVIASMINAMPESGDCWIDFDNGICDAIQESIDRLIAK